RMRPQLFGLGLELAVPPLSLLVGIWLMLLLICLLSWQLADGSIVPAVVLMGAAVFAFGAIFAGWVKFGRGMLPPTSLLAAPLYIVWKLPIYLRFVGSREKTWVRT